LKAILAKIRPEPVRKSLPPLPHFEPPSKGDKIPETRLKRALRTKEEPRRMTRGSEFRDRARET